ncbi:MAG: hypothetical protein JJT78_11835, partial [Leptospira sp.]|nr:hypothetical protein [Leptospira sp.]
GDSYNLLCNSMDDLIYRLDCIPNANRIDGVGDSFKFNRFQDPMLINPIGASVDVNFQANPPCRVVQLNNFLPTVSEDFNGNTRPSPNVSIGAIEHIGGCSP